MTTGERRSFEITFAGEASLRHFRIGVVSIDDPVSITITDIGEIKARERSFRLLFEGNPVPMWLGIRPRCAFFRSLTRPSITTATAAGSS